MNTPPLKVIVRALTGQGQIVRGWELVQAIREEQDLEHFIGLYGKPDHLPGRWRIVASPLLAYKIAMTQKLRCHARGCSRKIAGYVFPYPMGGSSWPYASVYDVRGEPLDFSAVGYAGQWVCPACLLSEDQRKRAILEELWLAQLSDERGERYEGAYLSGYDDVGDYEEKKDVKKR